MYEVCFKSLLYAWCVFQPILIVIKLSNIMVRHCTAIFHCLVLRLKMQTIYTKRFTNFIGEIIIAYCLLLGFRAYKIILSTHSFGCKNLLTLLFFSTCPP